MRRDTAESGGSTDDALGEGRPHERGQPQVADLHGAGGAGDKDVVALEVAVHDGRGAGVQKLQPLQDLSAPAAQHFGFHYFKALQVPAQHEQGRGLM